MTAAPSVIQASHLNRPQHAGVQPHGIGR